MPRKAVVHVPGFSKPSGVFSSAVVAEAKRLLFISGLLARNSAGEIVGVGDIRRQTRTVATATSVLCQEETHAPQQGYSITSFARTSKEGGTVRPSALAVLRLITSSNLVGCSTGRSEGLVPLRILST